MKNIEEIKNIVTKIKDKTGTPSNQYFGAMSLLPEASVFDGVNKKSLERAKRITLSRLKHHLAKIKLDLTKDGKFITEFFNLIQYLDSEGEEGKKITIALEIMPKKTEASIFDSGEGPAITGIIEIISGLLHDPFIEEAVAILLSKGVPFKICQGTIKAYSATPELRAKILRASKGEFYIGIFSKKSAMYGDIALGFKGLILRSTKNKPSDTSMWPRSLS